MRKGLKMIRWTWCMVEAVNDRSHRMIGSQWIMRSHWVRVRGWMRE